MEEAEQPVQMTQERFEKLRKRYNFDWPIITPGYVFWCPFLSDKAKNLYSLFNSTIDFHIKGIFHSNAFFGELLGVSERTIRKSISELARFKFIKRKIFKRCGRGKKGGVKRRRIMVSSGWISASSWGKNVAKKGTVFGDGIGTVFGGKSGHVFRGKNTSAEVPPRECSPNTTYPPKGVCIIRGTPPNSFLQKNYNRFLTKTGSDFEKTIHRKRNSISSEKRGSEQEEISSVKNIPVPIQSGKLKRLSRMVDLWNALETPSPKHSKETKVYKHSSEMLAWFANGEFLKKCSLDEDFIRKHKIPIKLVSRKWSEEQIESSLREASKLYVNGYWPSDKKKLPRTLPDLIYNPRTGTSMLLYAAFAGVDELFTDSRVEKAMKRKIFREEVGMFQKALFGNEKVSSGKVGSLALSVYRVEQAYLKHCSDDVNVSAIPTVWVFMKKYSEFISELGESERKSVPYFTARSILPPGNYGDAGFLWKRFVSHTFASTGIDMKDWGC